MQLALGEYVIADGVPGIDETVNAMIALIRQGATCPRVIACADAILDEALLGDPTRESPYDAIAAVRDWVAAHWFFVEDYQLPALVYERPDAEVVEVLHAPDSQLRIIAERGVMTGDCDDAAILAGALCAALGCEVRIQCAGYGLDNLTPYVHTWCEARPFGGGAFLELDVTRESQRLPDAAITRAATWSAT